MSRAGYPVRINHLDAWDDFRIILEKNEMEKISEVSDVAERCKLLFETLNDRLNLDAAAKASIKKSESFA